MTMFKEVALNTWKIKKPVGFPTGICSVLLALLGKTGQEPRRTVRVTKLSDDLCDQLVCYHVTLKITNIRC